jgi:streptogramin lyase
MRPDQHVLSTSRLSARLSRVRRQLTLCLVLTTWAGVARAQVHTDFPVTTPASGPEGIVTGPDGNLWFCEEFEDQIGRITPDGTVTEFPIPTAGSHPETIIVGPDGAMWFTELLGSKIGRITTAGVVTEFPIPTANSHPEGIALGPDGNIWFCETQTNKIGRLTTTGVFTEFPIPTVGSHPESGTAGPDGNLWFLENTGNKVLRVTTTGAMTEFPIPTAASVPWNITLGPDGNLWFTEGSGEKIGRITPAGVITEFPVTTPGTPDYIVAGPDGNLWYTEYYGNLIGRITTSGVTTEFPLPVANSHPYGIGAGPDGALWFSEQGLNKIGRYTTAPAIPVLMDVDASGDDVLEAGETAVVAPTWTNTLVTPQSLTGSASNLTGPAGPTYTIDDSTAAYGTIAAESSGSCATGGDCYQMTISGARPVAHWDATFTEAISPGAVTKSWKLHVGGSFADVPQSHQFYVFIENLFHNAVTGGCAGGYCPDNPVTRAQMAVFLLKGKLSANLYTPPPASGTVFGDVHIGDFAADWIEALAGFQITGGCGSGNYCPSNPVTRAQMAVFLLKAEHGSAYTPPPCTGVFNDVACPSQFADWIEQLSDEGITGGCGGGNYCPDDPIKRGQMAVFLVKTFKLLLYGP